MKRTNRCIIAALAAALTLLLGTVSVQADSTKLEGHCYFNGSKIISDFDSDHFARAVSNLQPGDDVSFTVTYTNEYKDETDWYMENAIEQTLEKTRTAKKVTGTGKAENGGYTYELIHYDKNNKKEVLFSSDEVGGEAEPADMEGLEQATNALEDWFYIQSLKKGESGKVVLHVAFEGETEVNDYMDTDGGLNVRFAVEIKPTVPGKPGKIIETGDHSSLMLWTALAVGAGLLLLLLAVISRKKDREEEEAEDRTGGEA